ncbi:uncharacterized protein J4E78_003018 [Alternaria triticimaculans]|uniref:uncharacterized protein n=1 Tax=Alternaria triticimaculans TaxID=297637 RepID=UPI0020C52427|nr:uncharacterized protein J4E78_003018 [Alternaria triticimaculans]KAI4665556.1 hypothetical protein J4E78_003018 [Alternaria triticimaculans]
MSTSAIQGPGILFVRSRISPSAKDILSEPTFLAWYDNEHIPEVVSTSGVDSAFRFLDIHKSSSIGNEQNPKPFLACYPMEDLAFTLGDEFKRIGFKSSALPGSGVIYDLADMDVSYLGIVGKTLDRREWEAGGPKYVITSGIRPEKQIAEEQVTAFFQKQISTLETSPQYMRTLRFKLLYARTNAQSRVFKGLPTTDEPHPEPSTWIAMHEFAGPSDGNVAKALSDGVSKAADEGSWGETGIETLVWKLDRVHGEDKFFE